MLTLEQLFPTKLVERDHEKSLEIMKQMPLDKRAMLTYNCEAIWQDGVLRIGYINQDAVWRPILGDTTPYNLCLHPFSYTQNSCHTYLDLPTGPPKFVWFPGYISDIHVHWQQHHTQLDEIRNMICRWRFYKPCIQVFDGRFGTIYDDTEFMRKFNDKYPSVYNKSGHKLRQLTVAAQNALTRFIIWMKRFTDSIWCTVPIEICRLIASHCRPYAR